MGQAKQRGTFTERQEAAYAAVDSNVEVRKKELEELEVFEQRQTAAIGSFITGTFEQIVRNNSRNPIAAALTRTDFSQVPLQNA
jgi:hypothetical protein